MDDLPVWDASVLTRMMGDNPALQSSLLKKFLALSQGQVAGILQAAARGDTARTGSIAHALKSSSRTVGALQLGELCMKIEIAGKAGNRASCKVLAEQLGSTFSAASNMIKNKID